MSIESIRVAAAPLRQALLEHPLYGDLHSAAGFRLFMERHVFAVWDFMSLLKALQRRLCSVDLPWLPPRDAAAARLINEIVLGEESDDDGRGGHASHFELYLRSMRGFAADTGPIERFLQRVAAGDAVDAALTTADVPPAAARFVQQTWRLVEAGDLPGIAAAFTFGREDLLPDVFRKIVERLDRQCAGTLADFRYYLERHIDVDGDRHGPMSLRLMSACCGDDPAKWESARRAAVATLAARCDLWNAIHDELRILETRSAQPCAASDG